MRRAAFYRWVADKLHALARGLWYRADRLSPVPGMMRVGCVTCGGAGDFLMPSELMEEAYELDARDRAEGVT